MLQTLHKLACIALPNKGSDWYQRRERGCEAEEEKEEFYKLLLPLLSYGTILAVKWQTWCVEHQ